MSGGRAGRVLVIGTMDTKAAELAFVRKRLRAAGLAAEIVDVSTSGRGGGADVPAAAIAAAHRDGPEAVFTGDRGTAVAGMAQALACWITGQKIAGAIGLGGSGGTAMIAPALRRLPHGVPKIMVSTLASGDVAGFVGTSDLVMMPSVADLSGLNRVSRPVLANAAAALAGMIASAPVAATADRPAVGLTMFGVTTTAVTQVSDALADTFDCIAFHATGAGGRAMEDLAVQGRLDAILDLTTTEFCDRLAGGIMPAGPDRIRRLAATGLPYVGSVGALDMVNFAAPESVPDRYRDRLFYRHNPQITLMRTTAEECEILGTEIAQALNLFDAATFLIPEGGVSALDASGQPFHDPAANAALFAAIVAGVTQTQDRRVIRLPHHINDPAFAQAAATALREAFAKARPT